MAQLVERSLVTPVIPGALVIGKFHLPSTVLKTKIKKKRPRMAQFKNKQNLA